MDGVINGMIYSSSWLWKGWFLCLPQFSDLTFPCLIECKSTSSPRRCASWEIVRCATQDWTSQPCPSTQGMKGSRSPGCRLQVGDSSTLISWVWVWIFFCWEGVELLGYWGQVSSGESFCDFRGSLLWNAQKEAVMWLLHSVGCFAAYSSLWEGIQESTIKIPHLFLLGFVHSFPKNPTPGKASLFPILAVLVLSFSRHWVDTGPSSRWGTWRQILHLVM